MDVDEEELAPAGPELERSPYGEYFSHATAGEPVPLGKIDAVAAAEHIIGQWRPLPLINPGTRGGIEGA